MTMRGIPKRVYRDDVELSIIGFGGIVVMGEEQERANRIVADAVERGVNYFDVAPSYGQGEAEQKLGPALRPFRDEVFLACKTTERSAEGAQKEFERSLQRLQTDHVDLYQFHAVDKMEDVDRILGPGGAAEFFLQAQAQGKTRFIGLSSHVEQAAIALMDRFPVASVLFPFNFVCWTQGGLGPRVLEQARRKGVARLALKALAHTVWPKDGPKPYPKCWYKPVDDPQLARLAIRFVLSEDITAAVTPSHEALLRIALDAAEEFQPLTPQERQAVIAGTAGLTPIFQAS